MAKPKHRETLLTVRIEGRDVGAGRIAVDHLLRLISEFKKALVRTGMVLQGNADSLRPGQRPQSITQEVALDLVLLTHGSPATVLGFERRNISPPLPQMDIGLEIIEKSISGLRQVQTEEENLPVGVDPGVLFAWRDVGMLFEQGIAKIEFSLNHRPLPIEATYTRDGFMQVQRRIRGPQVNVRTIEGRLLMADFKEHGTRCRIHPSISEPVLCLFDDSKRDEVLENILHYVRVTGEAREDPITHRISTISISDIQRVEGAEDQSMDLLPTGAPLPSDFWQSPTIEELAEAQGVSPLEGVAALFGTWPGEKEDGFEESVLRLRRETLAGGPVE